MLSAPVEDLKVEVLEQIGIVSDGSGFYEKMSLYKNLKAYAMLFGVKMTEVDDFSGKWDSMIAATRWLKNYLRYEAAHVTGSRLD